MQEFIPSLSSYPASLQLQTTTMHSNRTNLRQGEGTVASRVVFINGRPAKHLYRTYNIRTVHGVDDFKSMEEALARRFRPSKGI